MDNNSKALLGKTRFLHEMPGAVDATPDRVRQWLAARGLEAGKPDWVEVTVIPECPPRYINLAYTAKCVDTFLDRGGTLHGCELKVSGADGVSGLTVNEERLLREGHIRVYLVNPVRGCFGEADSEALLSVPRRVDGVPVGKARAEWLPASG